MLCGHSYGGMVISHAASGRDDVDRLVYLCALQIADDDEMTANMRPTMLMQHLVHGDDGSLSIDLEHTAECFYHDVDADTAAAAVARLRPMPLGVGVDAEPGGDVGPPAWTHTHSTYVVCTGDRAIHPETQREMARHAVDVVEWDTSHSPMLSQPERVADLLTSLAAQAQHARARWIPSAVPVRGSRHVADALLSTETCVPRRDRAVLTRRMTRSRAAVIEQSHLVDQLMHEVYPEFSESVAPEPVEALIHAELARWDDTKIRDFVPIFVRRQVRSHLRQTHPPNRAPS